MLMLPAPRITHVASIGGGLSSTMELVERMIARYGRGNCEFIYAYLPNEHPDMLDLIFAVEKHYGIDVKFIGHRMTPMEWFFKRGFLGNARVDPCSQGLKRDVCLKHLQTHHDPRFTVLHVGVTYHEIERMIQIRSNWNRSGWTVQAILADDPTITSEYLTAKCLRLFGWVPEMYWKQYPHNNCHGACVKAGKAQWKQLLRDYPGVYAEWEAGERFFRQTVSDHTILTEVIAGQKKPLSLEDLRTRVEAQPSLFDDDLTPPCWFCAAV